MTIQWDKKYQLNISVIDAQHKQIISCLNELELAMKEGVRSRNIDEILVRTEHYTTRHFGLEEKYMRETGYPELEKQLAAHKYFIDRMGKIAEEYREKGLSPAVVSGLKHELTDWIKNHVIGLDLAFGEYYKHYQKNQPDTPNRTNN